MADNRVVNDYFEWLYNLICGRRYSANISYRKLLSYLHSITFTYSIPRDANRFTDGISLRDRYAENAGYQNVPLCLCGPCSVLEMMIALSVRCEESIMDDPGVGDRTSQWFWGMITNMGLGSMMDRDFDKLYTEGVVNRFLKRDYDPDGKGGLFRIKNCNYDLRDIEIWYQLCWYLNGIT